MPCSPHCRNFLVLVRVPRVVAFIVQMHWPARVLLSACQPVCFPSSREILPSNIFNSRHTEYGPKEGHSDAEFCIAVREGVSSGQGGSSFSASGPCGHPCLSSGRG